MLRGGGIASDNCILFMWATYPMLREALKVIEAWGFTYKTVAFNWVKQNKTGAGLFWGLGNWTRSNSEICLLAVKGKPRRMSASVHSVILSPVQQHSGKPAEARDRIVELMGDLPRIELFARETAPGWDSWGNEVPASSTETEENDGTAHHIRGDGEDETAAPAGSCGSAQPAGLRQGEGVPPTRSPPRSMSPATATASSSWPKWCRRCPVN